MGSAVVVAAADSPLDDAEGNEVTDDCDCGDDETEDSDEGSQERDEHTLAEGKEESDKEKARGDGVEDHNIGQSTSGGLGGVGEVGAIYIMDDLGNVVSNMGIAAPVVAIRHMLC